MHRYFWKPSECCRDDRLRAVYRILVTPPAVSIGQAFARKPTLAQQAAGRDDGQGPGQVGDEGGRGRRGCTGGQVPGMSEAAKKQQQDLVDLAKLMGANVI